MKSSAPAIWQKLPMPTVLPINPSLAAACDAGKLADCHVAELDDCCDFLADNFQ